MSAGKFQKRHGYLDIAPKTGDEGDALKPPSQALRPFSRSLPMALLRAREAVMSHFRPSLQAAGLTEQQWRTLRALSEVEEIEATRLAVNTLLLAPSMSRILRDLEVRNLIHRRADPKDGRAALISLTATGWAALNQVGAQSEEIYRAIELRIGSARLNRLMETLTEIESDLDDMRSAEG
jgi:homoprotocatechuate degradation regulator HpaR